MNIKTVRSRLDVLERHIKGKVVLDLGCVDARPDGQKKYRTTGLHRFINQHSERVVGVDLDEDGVRQLHDDGYAVVCGNVESIDLGEKFDCIVAGEIVEHLSNPGIFLENMKRHLVENGTLILTVPNAFSISNIFRIIARNRIKVHDEHTCWFDPVTISRLLSRHSFNVAEIYFSNKTKWYLNKHLFKIKYQIPKLICSMRSYFSGTIIVVANTGVRQEMC